MGMTLRGPEGRLKHAWHDAATVGAWTLSETGSTVTLTGAVTTQDVYRVTQRPLTFEHRFNGRPMVWRVQELQIADGTLTASLVPQE